MPPKRYNPPRVSRIGQHRPKRAMAQAVKEKEKKGIKERSAGVVTWSKRSVLFFRKHLIVSIVFLLLLVFVGLGLFTSLFRIQKVIVSLDKKTGCLSEEYVQQYILTKASFMGEAFFFSEEELLRMHPCLRSFRFEWNPFSPTVGKVSIQAHVPILRVNVENISLVSGDSTAESIFNAPVDSEEMRFMLSNGSLVILDAEPEVPSIALRHFTNDSIDSVRITHDQLTSLLQLIVFCDKEFGFSPDIILAENGVLMFAAPFSERVYMSIHKDMREQLGSLQAVLRASTIDRSKLYSIDVRSGSAIIRYIK